MCIVEKGKRMRESNVPMYGKWVLVVEMGQEAKEKKGYPRKYMRKNERNQNHTLLPSMNHSNCHQCHD